MEREVIFSEMAIHGKKNITYMTDMLIMLIPCAALSVFYYRNDALRIIMGCTLCAVICDFFGTMLLKRENTLKDLSAVVTGLCVAMMLPSGAPLWLCCLTSAVAVCVGKLPFGNYDRVPFVPAAVGIAFATVCYPNMIFDYPGTHEISAAAEHSLTYMLTQGNSINMTVPGIINVIVGNCPGPIGATCSVLFFACAIYLLIRRINSFIVSAGFISVCALFAVMFPRVLSGRQASLIMELSGGMLLFAAVFLLTYPNVNFRSPLKALLYGMCSGCVCMLIRYFGTYEEGVCFAVLIMNAAAPFFEEKQKPEKNNVIKTKELQSDTNISEETQEDSINTVFAGGDTFDK